MRDPMLKDQIHKFFSERLNLNISSDEADLFETGALDSLGLVDLVTYLEEQFEVRISAEELEPENFRSIARIVRFIAARNGLKRTAAAQSS